jgi:dolichol kinase
MTVWKRKVYRMTIGSIFPVSYLVTGKTFLPVMLAVFFLTLLVALEYERWKNPNIWKYLLNKAGKIFREKPGKITGDTYFMFAVFLILVFFQKPIAVVALFFLVFGDAGSGIIGARYGRTEIFLGKTVEGLAGGLLFNIIIAVVILPFVELPFLLLLTGAVTASVVEILPLRIDDNLTVGLSSAAVMFFLLVCCP